MHEVMPDNGAKEPAEQLMQMVSFWNANRPAAHCEQIDAPTPLTVPAGQEVHEDEPLTAEKVPIGH